MAIEFVVGIGVGALLLGLLIGYFLPGGNKKKARVAELETALESAQEELAEYKREVFGQFAETAEKFRALDKSYNDLHRQLATSSVALCGDAATPLLEAPGAETLVEQKVSDSADNPAPESADQVLAEDESIAASPIDANEVEGPELPGDLQAPTQADDDSIVVSEAEVTGTEIGESEQVPTLTDVDAEEIDKNISAQDAPATGDVDDDRQGKRASA
jgi:uncharacterized membrane-anchored protein YhcB (DUF1043 family)